MISFIGKVDNNATIDKDAAAVVDNCSTFTIFAGRPKPPPRSLPISVFSCSLGIVLIVY